MAGGCRGCALDGTAVETVVETWSGKPGSIAPTTSSARSDGLVYFTDPPYGVKPEDRVLYISRASSRLAWWPGSSSLADDFEKPNGLAFGARRADPLRQRHRAVSRRSARWAAGAACSPGAHRRIPQAVPGQAAGRARRHAPAVSELRRRHRLGDRAERGGGGVVRTGAPGPGERGCGPGRRGVAPRRRPGRGWRWSGLVSG